MKLEGHRNIIFTQSTCIIYQPITNIGLTTRNRTLTNTSAKCKFYMGEISNKRVKKVIPKESKTE